MREVAQFKYAALTAAKQKWTVKECFHLFLPHLFSSFWWHFFLDLTHLKWAHQRKSGGRGAREPSKEKEKNVTFRIFFFTPETLQTVVCFICMCLSGIWGRGRDRHIKLGQLHVTQAVLNQNEHLSPECLCGSQKKKKKKKKKKNANGTVGPRLAGVKCMEVGQSVGDWSLLG